MSSASGSSILCFTLLVAGVGAGAWVLTRRAAPVGELPHPAGWALAGRGLGLGSTAVLLGGTVYTAYTVVAVPGLTYATGGFGLYALTYTVLLTPAALLVLPRLHSFARRHGLVTTADIALARHGSHALSLAVVLSGLLASMPYLALQVVGLEAALRAMGVDPTDPRVVPGILLVFTLVAAAVLPRGLRICARVAAFKALLTGMLLTVALVLLLRSGTSSSWVFHEANRRLTAGGMSQVPPDGTHTAYATLALGSVLAQLVYPQVVTVALAARRTDTLRRAVLALPMWTLALGGFAYLGFAALAYGITAPGGHAEIAAPALLRHLAPPWLAGLLLGGIAVAALLPAAVMAISMATLVARNIYTEYFNPTATPKHEVRIARTAAPAVLLGALVFALLLKPQDAVNLHLLGGVWIIQTVPTVGSAPFTRWFHPRALLAGWAAGMVTGTALVVAHGFDSVVSLGFGHTSVSLYVALVALALNLAVTTVLTLLLDRVGVPRGPDHRCARTAPPRRGSRFAFRVD
ncbi:sodium:solute symporter [Streptomyces sp. NPDC004250]|uniref:sodium:solute symporter family protein n=1 Tax=Streptomyces sp. NPDC004250 TaxID=3364692 RepID=UPI0036B3D242